MKSTASDPPLADRQSLKSLFYRHLGAALVPHHLKYNAGRIKSKFTDSFAIRLLTCGLVPVVVERRQLLAFLLLRTNSRFAFRRQFNNRHGCLLRLLRID